MNHPGVWIMGDTANDDRQHGMGIVVEYGGQTGKPQWVAPKPFQWDYAFAKQNAAADGFNRWTINDVAFAEDQMHPMFQVKQGKRYRLRMRKCKRRHPSNPPSPPQFRTDARRRAAHVRCH